MDIYVVEIGGLAIAAFEASSAAEAEGFSRQKWFLTDLTNYEHNDQPLWNGTDKLELRLSYPEEAAMFATSQIQGLAGNEKAEKGWVSFLLPISDPDDESWDDDED